MTTHIKSINRKVWKVVETKIEIGDPKNPTVAEEVLLQNNDIALSASFKMKEDESVLEMFHRLQVLVNDLKALGEEVKDKDFSHKFLRCLPSRFGTLVTILMRSDLHYKEKILGSYQQKLEPKNKEFDCRKR